MTLAFSQTWPKTMGELAGQPNYFVEKVLNSFEDNDNYYPFQCGSCKLKGMSSILEGGYAIGDTGDHSDLICPKCESWKIEDIDIDIEAYYIGKHTPKHHTIREDKSNRWKAGNDIHFVINNRTKNRFQFAPVVECISVQEAEIMHLYEKQIYGFGHIVVKIDGRRLHDFEIMDLAINDGFPSVEAFFDYFNTDFKGKIIHWTDLKY